MLFLNCAQWKTLNISFILIFYTSALRAEIFCFIFRRTTHFRDYMLQPTDRDTTTRPPLKPQNIYNSKHRFFDVVTKNRRIFRIHGVV